MVNSLIRWGMAAAWLISLHAQGPMVLAWHNDSARTGQNQRETILTPGNVNPTTFGRLTTITVDGKVDAQPLYVPSVWVLGQSLHNVIYVETEHNTIYAFDADTFTQLLHVSLNGSGETSSDNRNCGQVTPEIGITATPAIDLTAGPHGTIYVVAMSKDASSAYHQRLHALDLATLTEQFGGPVEIAATAPGSGAENTFLAAQHVERPGLLILNGSVYTTWGSHCDIAPYAGWVLSYNETTLAQTGVLNLEPNGSDGAIWAAGAGPAADSNGNIYLLTGNGTFDTTLNSSNFPAKGDFGNSFVKIATSSGGMVVNDYFTMTNTVSESAADSDLGSAGLLLLPQINNTQGQPVSLLVGAGKDGNIYVVNQSGMGKFNPSMDSIYQLMSYALPSGTWSSPAWFNGTLYYGGVKASLRAFRFAGGMFSLASQSSNVFPYPGITPSVSSNGTSDGVVWAVENASPAVLHAFDATNLSTELYNSNEATNIRDQFVNGNKFIVPTIANGKVYVGTQNGVGVFGLLTQGGGSLTISNSTSSAAVDLPTEGELDWIVSGSAGERKAGVPPQLSNYAVVGSATPTGYSNDPRSVSWSDGTPTKNNTGQTSGVFVGGNPSVINGFSITAPADTTSRRLILHVGGSNSAGTFTAHISDGSAPDYVYTASGSANAYSENFTLIYQAANNGQFITVTWTLPLGATGHVNVEAATLSLGSSRESQSISFAPIPSQGTGTNQFTISATASSGIPVSFNASPGSVCGISGGAVYLVAPGVCSIVATQGGNSTYAAATPVTQSFTVSPNLIDNGGFESGSLSPWQLLLGGRDATAAITSQTFIGGRQSAFIDIAQTSPPDWEVDFRSATFSLAAGKQYQVNFAAMANSTIPIEVVTQGGPPNWSYYGLASPVVLTNGHWSDYSLTFVASAAASDASLEFWLGAQTSKIWIDNVQLFPTGN